MRLKGLTLILAAIIGWLIFPCPADAFSVQAPIEGWMGMYMAGDKIGYMHLTVDKAKYNDLDCYKVQSFVRTKLLILGTPVQQDVRTIMYTDERFTPYFQTFEMASGGHKTTVEAAFQEKEIKCRLITDSSASNSVIPIPEGISLIGDSMYVLGGDKLSIGQKASMSYFNPLTMAIDSLKVEVLRKEMIELNGTNYDTFVVKNVTPMGEITSWQTEEGGIVKSLTPMGVTMQIETAENAVAGVDSDYSPPLDFAILTSVKADKDIPEPEKVRKMTVELTGALDDGMLISDDRQTAAWIASDDKAPDETRTARFIVQSIPFDAKKSVKLPIKDEEYHSYLTPTSYIESEAPEIKAKAAEIVGKESSAYAAAVKINKWVSKSMRPQADIGIARPATDVLKSPVGVCRDYAVLYAALARASGIPTKIVAGLVFMNGNFYYHAWAESYVGEWTAVDPTRKSGVVDATHIKLTEGDATNMYEMASVFGSLKAKIVRFD